MLTRFRQEVRLLRESPPGERFEARYERHRSLGLVPRLAGVFVGLVVVLAGVLMLVFPGPGWVAIALGVGLLGGESRTVSRLLDRTELRARALVHRHWDRRSDAGKLVIATTALTVGGVLIAGGAWLGYRYREALPFA